MATYTGQLGSLTIGANAYAELKSFSVEHTTNTIEDTVMGDGSRSYVGGLKEWSGSADIIYSETVGEFVQNTDGSSNAFIGYPAGSTSGYPKLTGNVIITGISINANIDGMVEASISFQGSGDLTIDSPV